MVTSKKFRNFAITWNNYPEDWKLPDCRYYCVGKEISPTTGTPHLQGVIVFRDPITLSCAIKKLRGCHVGVCKKPLENNVIYCSKDKEVIEFGDRSKTKAEQGAEEKARWEEIKRLASTYQFDQIDPSVMARYGNQLLRFPMHYGEKPKDLPELNNLWIYGPTGCGKSRYLREQYPVFYNKSLTKWWDGYKNEEVVLIDDIGLNDRWMATLLKQWADHYAFPAEVKGGMIHIRPKMIIVTSNYEIQDLFSAAQDHEPIYRRFKVIDLLHQKNGI